MKKGKREEDLNNKESKEETNQNEKNVLSIPVNQSDLKLSVITEKSEEYNSSDIQLSVQKKDGLSIELMKSILLNEGEAQEDELKNQIQISKRSSLDTIGSLKNKGEKPNLSPESKKEKKIEIDDLYEIREEYAEEKEREKEDEKKDDNKIVSKPSMTISKKAKEMRRVKTDGNLPTFGGSDSKAAEERRNRLAKRLNKAKEINKKREEENKYRKSVDISMKAALLQNKMSDKKEDIK